MKYNLNNKILEAVNRGIKFALDDFDDQEEIQGQSNSKINHGISTKEYLDLMEDVVDLELPSGTLWCKYNLDVNPNQLSKAENWYGGYYAWGELKQKPSYEYDNYTYIHFPKYCNDSQTDCSLPISQREFKLTELLPEDDAAYQNKKLHNFKFHIPTKEQCEELIKYTQNYWVNNYNPNKLVHNQENDSGILSLDGQVFKGKNGNQLFIPAAGYQITQSNEEIGYVGCIRSASLDINKYESSYILYCWRNKQHALLYSSGNRCWGMNIRPVINL